MPLVLKDRVRETTTTAGTGTVTLAGAVFGFQSFSAIGNGNTTYYAIVGQTTNEWEVGIGTYTSSGTTLSRDSILASSNGGTIVTFSAGTKDVFVTYPAELSVNEAVTNIFTASQTFRAADAIRSEVAATQDAVVIAGRAGGTLSYAVTLTPTTLSANRTLTLPNVTDTVATIGTAQTFTAAQTFRAANAIRSEAASTQDAVVIAGRAGGTSSYAVTLTPATLSASRTVTIPDETFTVGFRNLPAVGTKTGSYTLAVGDVGKYVQLGSGGAITIPTSTFAEGDAITLYNNTTGNITITCSAPTAYIAGTNTIKTSMTLATRGVATVLFYSATACVVSGNVS